ncbi:YybH family protein [Pseudoclavibacter helvolus]|uniref:YybH family protein n=1 Tax=Pseudoclavibacter helvolus TaxID=255205 RepID=UPI003C7635D3
MPTTPSEDAVLAAADAIIEAFAATDTDAYFAGFAADASFVFHPEPARLDTRATYEALWASWLADGWRVTSCASTDRLVQAFPGGAVFSHSVETSVETPDGPETYRERETIVFRVDDDRLLAIHEHLSAPTGDSAPTLEGTSA